MSIKNRILFIGVGQGGGNITNLFEKKGYACTYINSSNHDLDTVDTDYSNKFHLTGADGCSMDIEKGEVLLKKHGSDIVDFITNKYPNQDLIFVVHTDGGGTGAGIGPGLIDALTNILSDRYVGGISVVAALDDTIQSIKNSAATWAKLTTIDKSAALFVIDNNKGSKLKLNRKFVELFDRAVNVTNPDKRGIIDNNEIFTLLTTPGLSVILETYEEKDSGRIGIHNSVFVEYARSRDTIAGVSCKNRADIVKDVLEETVGYLKKTFSGYNEESDLIILSGLNQSKALMDEMVEIVTEKESEMDSEGFGTLTNPFAKETSSKVNGFVATEQRSTKKRDKKSILKNYFN